MPKFKVGDKIEFEMDGKKVSGTITRDYNSPGHAMYDVRVGTKTMTIADTPMHPANACASNARYSAATPLKSIDYQLEDLYGSNAKLGDLIQEYKAKRYVEYIDRAADTMARDKVYDALEALTGIKCKWAVNSANSRARNAKIVTPENFSSLRVGDKVDFRKSRYYKGIGVVTKVYDEDIIDIKDDKGEILEVHSDDIMNARACNSRNPIVRNAMNACGAARNAGIWESTEEAEDRSDVFVRAALGRTKYNFDSEAQTLREVIKLLASAEQTPKIKKNTEKLKGILSRVEKAAVLFRGI